MTIPYDILVNGCALSGNLTLDPSALLAGDPFPTRESLESALHHRVLRRIEVNFSPETLDNVFAACNSIVEARLKDYEEDAQMTFPDMLEYENDRLNFDDRDEELGWREKHDILRGVDAEPNEELDIEALIKTALSTTLDR